MENSRTMTFFSCCHVELNLHLPFSKKILWCQMHVFRGKYGKNRHSSRVKDGKGELREQQTQSSDSICPHAQTGDQRRKKK